MAVIVAQTARFAQAEYADATGQTRKGATHIYSQSEMAEVLHLKLDAACGIV